MACEGDKRSFADTRPVSVSSDFRGSIVLLFIFRLFVACYISITPLPLFSNCNSKLF